MRAVIRLELIGDNYQAHLRAIESGKARHPHIKQYVRLLRYGHPGLRPWVARLVNGKREFIESSRDYAEANSSGSRGIYEYYALTPGVYEVNECVRLGQARRYCIQVEGTAYKEIECPSANVT
jgi:hypothetical protein